MFFRIHRESDLFFLDLQTLRAEDEGWLVLDVTAASDHWLLNRSKDLGLRLYMETEDGKDGQAAHLLRGSDQRGRVASQLCSFLPVTSQVPYPPSPFSHLWEEHSGILSSTRCLGAEPPSSRAVGVESPKAGPRSGV